jgi:hypothetical protein
MNAGNLPAMGRSHDSLWLGAGTSFTTAGVALAGIAGSLDAARANYHLWISPPMIAAYATFGLAATGFAGAVRDWRFPFAAAGRPPEPTDGEERDSDPAGQSAVPRTDRQIPLHPGDVTGANETSETAGSTSGDAKASAKPVRTPANAGGLPSSPKQVRQPSSQISPQPRSPGPDRMRCLYEAIRELHEQSAEIRKLLPVTRARRIVLKMIIPTVESNLDKLKCVDPAVWRGDTTWAANFSLRLSSAADKLRDVESDLGRGRSPEVTDLLRILDQLYQLAAEEYPQMLLS